MGQILILPDVMDCPVMEVCQKCKEAFKKYAFKINIPRISLCKELHFVFIINL